MTQADTRSGVPDLDWVRRADTALHPDPARVLATLFLPGQELLASGESRSGAVLGRVLRLSEAEVDAELGSLTTAFADRHRNLAATWDAHYAQMRHRLVGAAHLTPGRQRLIGAYFTQEYAVEAAALFNPSMVAHPDQSGLAPGSTRFVMTVRAIGEGHLSSMEMRTGIVDARDVVTFDSDGTVAVPAAFATGPYSRVGFEYQLDDLGGDRANSDFVLGALGPTFDRRDLDRALGELRDQRLTRGAAIRTIERFEWIAGCTYQAQFPAGSALNERVLMPHGPSESCGMEDVRMARFAGPDGDAEYLGTYTAFDGREVSMQLLRTRDFTTFTATPLSGPGARNKGMALFPRMVGDRYLAMSRADRESPLLTPSDDERSGYVPNVVYSCGAMLHGRTLVLPYGASDSTTRIALVDVDGLLDELVR